MEVGKAESRGNESRGRSGLRNGSRGKVSTAQGSRKRIGTTHWKSQEGQCCAKEVAGRSVSRTGSRGRPILRKESRRKVSTAQMESREGQYCAKEVAGGQYRVREVTGRLVPHTRSRRKVTTAQTKSLGVITAHWRSLIKSGSIVATLRIPDIPSLALRGSCNRCYLYVHRRCDRPAAPVCPLVRRPSLLRPCVPRRPSPLGVIDLRPPPPFPLFVACLLCPCGPRPPPDLLRPCGPNCLMS